jgi:sensor histidine kinase regulating citrate/malate metabolism
MRHARVALATVLAALLLGKTSQANERGVELVVSSDSRLDDGLLPESLSARDLVTILGNLIDNAVDVSVGADPARVTVRIDDREGLTISVADSGPGVPEHIREEIFARGVTSKPDVPGGRGIGLALVRLVTAQLGGTVEVSDGPAEGAMFVVRLPESVTTMQAAHA